MRTPVDEEFHALGRLLGPTDPGRRHAALIRLAEHVASCPPADDETMDVLAGLLPTTLTGPPEADLLLAGLYERLGHRLTGRPRPPWRAAAGRLPARVRIAWLRADVLHDPGLLRDEAPGELLYQAVRGAGIAATHRPAWLVDELAGSGDPVLRAEALRLARDGLHAALLAPAQVRETLTALLGASGAPVVAGALDGLAEPWAATDPLPPGLFVPLLFPGHGPDPSEGPASVVAGAALVAAARHGHRDLLRRAVADPRLAPGLRRRAMELLGEAADRDDIDGLTAAAARDPLLLGAPAVACLRGLHRRGHFPDGPAVRTVIELALADHSILPRDVATILYTSRTEMLRVLTDAPAGDPGWPRRLDLLVALAGQGAGDLPIGEAVARVLPAAPDPAPFLDAIRALRHTDAEEAVIALLPSAPAVALDTLEAIGGEPTVRALHDGLGLAADGTAPHLRPVRDRALELLWQLNRDPARRGELLARLDPVGLPPRIAADLGGPDARELALLSSHLDPEAPVAALCRLAAHGDAGTLPVIADLLLRIVAGQAAARTPDAAVSRTAEHGKPAGEPVVPQEVLDAVSALGRRLHGRGAIRPVCLLGAADAREAGNALVATVALDLLDRPGLSDDEQVVLLEVLLRAPWKGTRARVHRLLRHRDRHVRKHVIAVLAHDTTGEDAQALSATLITLTRAQDIQTVRQALLALGHARARWASAAIAACLDHPNMNIRKTAAEALVRAGTPVALPKLLARLGQDSNPGLRATLVAALRAILGDAYAATLIAAAEHSRDEAARRLLLEGLDGVLAARSVLALDEQASPVAPALLALVAARRVAPASGTVKDLVPAMARHQIAAPAATGPSAASGAADHDIDALVTGGWDPEAARRLAVRDEPLGPAPAKRLRPMAGNWLALAGSLPEQRDKALRNKLLRFGLGLCPEPRSAEELTAFSRSAPLLLDALAEARDVDRHDLIAILEGIAPLLTATATPAAVAAVRALAPAPATPHRSTLTLLRRLGAVPVRADLDRALAAARTGADPWRAETAVLREAFAVPEPDDAAPVPAGARAWRSALAEAVRAPDALAGFRRTDDGTLSSRDRLAALIEAHRGAAPGVRPALIDWMTWLQPVDAPPWTLAESARVPEPPPRRVRVDDLDQPRSAALRERLLAMLGSAGAEGRQTAAEALARWPEPEARLAVLRAYLRGRVTLPAAAGPTRLLGALGETELRDDGILRDRVARAAAGLGPWELERLVPLLLEWWEDAPPAVARAIGDALRAYPADALAEALGDRLDAGAWGYLELLAGRPLLRTAALTRTRGRLRTEGRTELADRLRLVEGRLRGPEAGQQDAEALAALRDRAAAGPTTTAHRPTRQELLDLAGTGTPDQICRALTELAAEHPGPEPDRDPQLLDLLGGLLTHPRPRVRLRAHRTSRTMLGRSAHLRHTALLLDDPRPDVVRMAVLTLCRAGWEPALPAVTELLGHPHAVVREAAAEGLVGLGGAAVPALRHATARARPDRRSRYTEVLDRIGAGGAGGH
ncbi:HEAT repeat domain-containing protein [Streptomyces sp. OR43]|uniref:HEAT repeat domain-containing protein n=1 Tax=Streptomyces sp. or43 TaxID=2478957 RepID=UPI0011CE75B2|nr:HEAT repeat domain-containing protein [Streptomyces sp. or43]TXS47328.1 HEAT repeat domain-containing protein [Streptomyces sp. or43]